MFGFSVLFIGVKQKPEVILYICYNVLRWAPTCMTKQVQKSKFLEKRWMQSFQKYATRIYLTQDQLQSIFVGIYPLKNIFTAVKSVLFAWSVHTKGRSHLE